MAVRPAATRPNLAESWSQSPQCTPQPRRMSRRSPNPALPDIRSIIMSDHVICMALPAQHEIRRSSRSTAHLRPMRCARSLMPPVPVRDACGSRFSVSDLLPGRELATSSNNLYCRSAAKLMTFDTADADYIFHINATSNHCVAQRASGFRQATHSLPIAFIITDDRAHAPLPSS